MANEQVNSTPAPEITESAENSSEVLETAEENSQENDQLADGQQNPAKPKDAKVEQVKRMKKLKLRVDGKDYEEEINLDDDEYLTRQLQLAKAAQKRMQEYSELQREVAEFVNMLKKDPRRALSDPSIGVDIKDLARQVIEEEIANSQKSPEQLEREKLETELREMKEEREREKDQFRQQELTRRQAQEFERYDMLMTQALEKSDLPKSPYIVKKMADYMLLGLEKNIELTPDEILPLVREEIQNDIREMFGAMPEEIVENLIGKDIFAKVRKKNLAKAKQAPPVPVRASVKDVGQTSKGDKKDDKPKMTYKEFFKM